MANIFTLLASQGHLYGAALHILSAGQGVYSEVETAMRDGSISADEARDIGVRVANELGDLRVMVNGHDILHMTATEEILGGIARIARQVVLAKQKPRG